MELRGKQVGVAPRPRVAYVGDDEIVYRSLVELFPTVHRVGNIFDLPSAASPAELDLIVSVDGCPNSYHTGQAELLEEYEACHLILFGTHGWLENEAPPPRKAEHARYRCTDEARSAEYTLRDDLDPRLTSALEAGRPPSALGLPVIQLLGLRGRELNDTGQPGWLAWALHPQLPLALSIIREDSKKGLAWFPFNPANRVALVRAICAVWAKEDRDAFPNIVEWHDSVAWMTEQERQVLNDDAALMAAFREIAQKYTRDRDALRLRFAAAKQAADAGPRALLTTQDEALVGATKLIFEDLGFEVANVDENRPPNAQKREDLQLRVPGDTTGWVAIVEVKGHRKRGANAEDLTKIERHVRGFLKQEGRDPSVKMYVCNAQFAVAPEDRDTPYQSHPEQVEHFCNDPDVPGVIVPTPDLFRLHRDRNVIGLDEARRLLLVPGVFRYPP